MVKPPCDLFTRGNESRRGVARVQRRWPADWANYPPWEVPWTPPVVPSIAPPPNRLGWRLDAMIGLSVRCSKSGAQRTPRFFCGYFTVCMTLTEPMGKSASPPCSLRYLIKTHVYPYSAISLHIRSEYGQADALFLPPSPPRYICIPPLACSCTSFDLSSYVMYVCMYARM